MKGDSYLNTALVSIQVLVLFVHSISFYDHAYLVASLLLLLLEHSVDNNCDDDI